MSTELSNLSTGRVPDGQVVLAKPVQPVRPYPRWLVVAYWSTLLVATPGLLAVHYFVR